MASGPPPLLRSNPPRRWRYLIDALQLILRLDVLLVAAGLYWIDTLDYKLPGIGVQSACFCKTNLGKGAERLQAPSVPQTRNL